eukprot:12465584-Heterocapsa_arctica.AAC.1
MAAVAVFSHWSCPCRSHKTAAAPDEPSLVPPSKETCTAGPFSPAPVMCCAEGTVISSPAAMLREAVRVEM